MANCSLAETEDADHYAVRRNIQEGGMLGHVKWFSDVKGYGFVVTEDQPDQDIFVHYTAIQTEGFKSLVEGQPVTFELKDGPKGPFAFNVCAREEEVSSTEVT